MSLVYIILLGLYAAEKFVGIYDPEQGISVTQLFGMRDEKQLRTNFDLGKMGFNVAVGFGNSSFDQSIGVI